MELDVSIHAPARGATPRWPPTSSATCSFNSRAREGRDPRCRIRRWPLARFNSRAREGRDSGLVVDGVASLAVSIHAPARGATLLLGRGKHDLFCFNSRAREGRDTAQIVYGSTDTNVSIHAPARGATCDISSGCYAAYCFNSRAREGRDPRQMQALMELDVSIHAPARGATTAKEEARPKNGFNSRAREGRDYASMGRGPRGPVFQFTRPRGARQLVEYVVNANHCVSIHAPARGATKTKEY